MFYSKQYNQYVTEGTAFTLGEVQYPSNWLNCSSVEEKLEVGLVEVVVVGAPMDDKYYWVSTTLEDGVLTYVNTPKDLAGLKESSITQLNATAYSLLFTSDWMVIRAAEGTPIAPEWTTYRAAVRTAANTARDAIDAATDVDSLITACNVDWPKDPLQPTTEGTV